ncbi:MAG: Ig-like domain-containing protein [Prevotellaceae bacterium]|nr:Ig-like domain-containing protein [Prevotellaceae bacterium]
MNKKLFTYFAAILMTSFALWSCKDKDPETKPVTGVSLNKTALVLVVGDTAKLTAAVQPADATVRTVTWTSSATSVATVATDGTVTAVAAGSANITVTAKDGGKTATCAVTVTDAVVAVTGVEISETAISLKIGDKQTLTATVKPDNATNKEISWSSDDPVKASVSASGEVFARAEGTVTITVTTADGNKTATCVVTVTTQQPGGGKTIKTATKSLFAGGDAAGFENGTGAEASFNNPRGMTIDADGNLYVADYSNHAIRKITPAGVVTTFIGNSAPDWEICANGPADVVISNGWLYIAERIGSRIRRVKLGLSGDPGWPNDINVFAGDDNVYNPDPTEYKHVNGQGTAARFANLRSITVDDAGNFYVADFYNRLIRKITSNGTVSDHAGVLCEGCPMGEKPDDDMLSYPQYVCWNPVNGKLYVAALNRERIVQITNSGEYTTFAGKLDENGQAKEVNGDDYNDGAPAEAEFARPAVICSDQSGHMFLGEQGGCNRLRFITPEGFVSTIAAGATPLTNHGAFLPKFDGSPNGIAVSPDGKTLYVAEGHKIWKIELTYN